VKFSERNFLEILLEVNSIFVAGLPKWNFLPTIRGEGLVSIPTVQQT
jgi:hypothetical protein